ncbi:MAG TPA: hypothetical protein PK265_01520 [Candidatus Saccharibacteria bacterium]|nr:hypothetical protein [Candidatus Saccharibacteria bacterium]HRQ97988.1 hypothetical protein [Candidatus Saccharibacteria bacterium]
MSEQGILFICGLVVALVAYFSKNFIFDQLLVYRKTVGRVKNRLRYHAGIITNDVFPPEITDPIRIELRQLSCDLDECYYAIPFVRKLHKVYFVPSPNDFDKAASQLIFLSNNTGRKNSVDKNDEAMNKILAALKLERK